MSGKFINICKVIYSPVSSCVLWLKLKNKNKGRLSLAPSANTTLDSEFEGCNAISAHSFFKGRMGYGTYISDNCNIEGCIGRFCSIAPNVSTHRGIHPITFPYVATSPMFFSLRSQNGHTFAKEQRFEEMTRPIEIGHDCWICSNVFICGGVRIGNGAIVYAGAVVTKNIPPYAIVAGVPAKVIKYRYDEGTIQFLLKTEWWNRPIEWLKEHWMLMNDIDKLKEYESLHKESQTQEG